MFTGTLCIPINIYKKISCNILKPVRSKKVQLNKIEKYVVFDYLVKWLFYTTNKTVSNLYAQKYVEYGLKILQYTVRQAHI